MPSIGAKKVPKALPAGIYLSNLPPDPKAPTETDCTNFPLVRGGKLGRCFWHDGYAYIFIAEHTTLDIIYNSSSDGKNYTKPSTGNPVVTKAERGDTDWAYQVDIYLDGNKVYVVVAEQDDGGAIKIREGTPSNGTITWGSWITAVSGVSGQYPMFVSLTKTTDGYFWVAYTRCPAASPYYYDVLCVKSSSPNSITSWGTPVVIFDETASTGFKNCLVVSLSVSTVYIMYYRWGLRLYGKTFDGSTVGSEETISVDYLNSPEGWSGCSDGDYNICAIYQNYTNLKIMLRRRVAGTWQSEIETPIVPAPSYFNGFTITRTSTTKIYLFYNEEIADPYFKFYYRSWNPATGFSGAVLLADNEEVTTDYNEEIASNHELQIGTLIGLWFRTGPPPYITPTRCVIVSGLT
jgi:hypothetical protein